MSGPWIFSTLVGLLVFNFKLFYWRNYIFSKKFKFQNVSKYSSRILYLDYIRERGRKSKERK